MFSILFGAHCGEAGPYARTALRWLLSREFLEKGVSGRFALQKGFHQYCRRALSASLQN
jgi:hypothetical protein